jgi:hypothetical protein
MEALRLIVQSDPTGELAKFRRSLSETVKPVQLLEGSIHLVNAELGTLTGRLAASAAALSSSGLSSLAGIAKDAADAILKQAQAERELAQAAREGEAARKLSLAADKEASAAVVEHQRAVQADLASSREAVRLTKDRADAARAEISLQREAAAQLRDKYKDEIAAANAAKAKSSAEREGYAAARELAAAERELAAAEKERAAAVGILKVAEGQLLQDQAKAKSIDDKAKTLQETEAIKAKTKAEIDLKNAQAKIDDTAKKTDISNEITQLKAKKDLEVQEQLALVAINLERERSIQLIAQEKAATSGIVRVTDAAAIQEEAKARAANAKAAEEEAKKEELSATAKDRLAISANKAAKSQLDLEQSAIRLNKARDQEAARAAKQLTDADRFVQSLDKEILSLRNQIAVIDLGAAGFKRYEAAVSGAGSAAESQINEWEKLKNKLQELKQAQEDQARKLAEEKSARDGLLSGIRQEIAALNEEKIAVEQGAAALLAHKAAALGLTNEVKPLAAELLQLQQALKQSQADKAARDYQAFAAAMPAAAEGVKKVEAELAGIAGKADKGGAALSRMVTAKQSMELLRLEAVSLEKQLETLPPDSDKARAALTRLAQVELANGKLSGEISKISNSLSGVKEQKSGIDGVTQSISQLVSGVGLLVSAVGGLSIFKKGAGEAFEFNKTIESSQIGIAALVRTFDKSLPEGADRMAKSMEIARNVQGQLQVENLKTIATYDQLLRAFQEGAGPALAAGFSTDQVVKFSSAIAKTAGVLRQPLDQIGQEMRTIMEGVIDKNARIGKTLKLTSETIKEWQAQGPDFFFAKLMKAMNEFTIAGEGMANSFEGAFSNLQDIVQRALGEGLEGVFSGTTQGIIKLQKALVTVDEKTAEFKFKDEITNALRDVDAEISGFISSITAQDLSEYIKTAANTGKSVLESLIEVGRAGKFIVDNLGPAFPVLAKAAFWIAAIGGPALTAAGSLGVFKLALGGLAGGKTAAELAAIAARLAAVETASGLAAPAITGIGASAGLATVSMLPFVAVVTASTAAVYKAVTSYGEMVEAQEMAADAGRRADALKDKEMSNYRKIRQETGLLVFNYKQMREAFEKNGVTIDETTGKYVTSSQAAALAAQREKDAIDKTAKAHVDNQKIIDEYKQGKIRLFEIGTEINKTKEIAKAFGPSTEIGRAALERFSELDFEKGKLNDSIKKTEENLEKAGVTSEKMANYAEQAGLSAEAASTGVSSLGKSASEISVAGVNGLNTGLDQTIIKAGQADSALANMGSAKTPSAPAGGPISFIATLDTSDYVAKSERLKEDIASFKDKHRWVLRTEAPEFEPIRAEFKRLQDELARNESVIVLTQKMAGLRGELDKTKNKLSETRQVFNSGKLTIDSDHEVSAELDKQAGLLQEQINLLAQQKFVAESTAGTFEIIGGEIRNISPAVQAAKSAYDSLRDSSGNIKTEWKEIGGVWQEVLPNGKVLLDEVDAKVKASLGSAGQLGPAIAESMTGAAGAIKEATEEADKLASAAGSAKFDELISSMAGLDQVREKIKLTETQAKLLGIETAAGKQKMMELFTLQGVENVLQKKVDEQRKSIYEAGKEAEEAAKKIKGLGEEVDTTYRNFQQLGTLKGFSGIVAEVKAGAASVSGEIVTELAQAMTVAKALSDQTGSLQKYIDAVGPASAEGQAALAKLITAQGLESEAKKKVAELQGQVESFAEVVKSTADLKLLSAAEGTKSIISDIKNETSVIAGSISDSSVEKLASAMSVAEALKNQVDSLKKYIDDVGASSEEGRKALKQLLEAEGASDIAQKKLEELRNEIKGIEDDAKKAESSLAEFGKISTGTSTFTQGKSIKEMTDGQLDEYIKFQRTVGDALTEQNKILFSKEPRMTVDFFGPQPGLEESNAYDAFFEAEMEKLKRAAQILVGGVQESSRITRRGTAQTMAAGDVGVGRGGASASAPAQQSGAGQSAQVTNITTYNYAVPEDSRSRVQRRRFEAQR